MLSIGASANVALLQSELRRIRHELGYNVLDAGADPYIGVTAVFDQVVLPYMQAGAVTTSTVAVAAPSVAGTFAPVSLTLASATGFAQFDRAIIDVDSRQEIATISSISGSVITVLLSLAHSGTYPVSVEGGESIVRDALRKITNVGASLEGGAASAGIKKADEVEFFGDTKSSKRTEELRGLREYYRRELADILGVTYLRDRRRRSGGTVALY